MKIILKENKAITLIALVITIVVLIILAAVAINLSLGNNGIFNRAKTAKEQYTNAQDYEETEIAKASNQIDSMIDGNRGTITQEQLNQLLYPNKTLNITAFSDTTTEQTYTIPKDGWLFITGWRNSSGYTTDFYRNDMLILRVYGAPNSSNTAGTMNSIYVPVKNGDIIKKLQPVTGYSYMVYLYYYE